MQVKSLNSEEINKFYFYAPTSRHQAIKFYPCTSLRTSVPYLVPLKNFY